MDDKNTIRPQIINQVVMDALSSIDEYNHENELAPVSSWAQYSAIFETEQYFDAITNSGYDFTDEERLDMRREAIAEIDENLADTGE